MSLLSQTLAAISPPSRTASSEADARQALLTKPRGSMGRLEDVGSQLAGIAGSARRPSRTHPAIAVFAADHGVHAQGVTPWPQEVTAQMVANLAAGGAVVNALARQIGASVTVVDVGVATDLPDAPNLLRHKVAHGTADMTPGAGDEPGRRRSRPWRRASPWPLRWWLRRRPAGQRGHGHRQHHGVRGARSRRSPA